MMYTKQMQTGRGLSIKALEKKLWRKFARYIKLRDTENGFCRCISCGEVLQTWYEKNGTIHWSGSVQAGHYYNKGSGQVYRSLKYDEKNVNGQCAYCNLAKEGNKQGYRKGLIEKYGPEVIEYLDLKKHNKTTYRRGELLVLIDYYDQKLTEELTRHGLTGRVKKD